MSQDIYEIHSPQTPIQGVGCRMSIQLFGVQNGLKVEAWNLENGKVRFAIPRGEDASGLILFLKKKYKGAEIEKIEENASMSE